MSAALVTLGLMLAAPPPADPEALATRPEMHSREEARQKLQAISRLAPQQDSELRQLVREAAWMLASDDETLPDHFAYPFRDASQLDAFREGLVSHQKNISYKQFQHCAMLEDLEIKSDERDREPGVWKTHCDFVMAQLAIRVAELFEHNAQLGQLRRNLAVDPNTAGWRLVPGNGEGADRDVVRSQARAKKYLDRLVRENPGTDWERIARRQTASFPPLRHWQSIPR